MQPLPDRPVNVGIVSAGSIASTVVADMLLVSEDVSVRAVAARDLDRARQFADRFTLPRAYGSYAELLADPEIDAVYIATVHSEHRAVAEAALKAGKHVLCEKPLTTSAVETAALVELARERDLFLMEAVWTRCNPLIRQAADMVKAGELGELRLVSADFGFHQDVDPQHRLFNPAVGGGAVLDLGVYPAHMAQTFASGAPLRLVAAAGTRTSTGVDVNSSALVMIGDHAEGVLSCSLDVDLPQTLVVAGTTGTLIIPQYVRPTAMTLLRGEHRQEYFTNVIGAGYTFEISEFARCLRAGLPESPLVGWHATMEVAELVDGWLASLPAA